MRIQFLNTGYIKDVLCDNALRGNVKDDTIKPLRTHIKDDNYEIFLKRKLRCIWHSMMWRCYNKSHKEYYAYGAIGVSVSEEWHDFETFYNDCKSLLQYDKFYNDPYNYQLDKDYLQLHIPKCNRIYSKETCVFLSNRDNTNLRAIENKMNNTLTSEYYGVTKMKNVYVMGITINSQKIQIRFNNEIAAANAYNYWFEREHLYELVRLHNDVPYMSVQEFMSYARSPLEMIKSIN